MQSGRRTTVVDRVFQLMEAVAGRMVPIGTGWQTELAGEKFVITARHVLPKSGRVWVRRHTGERENRTKDFQGGESGRIVKLAERFDIAILEVDWKGEETGIFKVGYPKGMDTVQGTEVAVTGFPDLGGRAPERMRVAKTHIQCAYHAEGVPMFELPYPAHRGMSGSPVLYHDWGVADGLDYVIGMVTRSAGASEKEGAETTSFWSEAVNLGETLGIAMETARRVENELRKRGELEE